MDGLPARGAAVRQPRAGAPARTRCPASGGHPAAQALALRGRLHARADAVRGRRPDRPACRSAGGRWRCPTGTLRERTTIRRGGVSIEPARACACSARRRARSTSSWTSAARGGDRVRGGRRYIWTAKQAAIPVRGPRRRSTDASIEIDCRVRLHGRLRGLPPRHTVWRWSAGVGRTDDGRARGVEPGGRHARLEPRAASARYGWTASHARSARRSSPPTCSAVGRPATSPSGRRARRTRTSLVTALALPPAVRHLRRRRCPAALELAEGYGVMEEHEAWW